MKELTEKIYHDEQYDIDINRYLTYAQIQQIVNAVELASKEDDSWSARQTNIDMLVLFHATNIGKDRLEEIGHDMLVQSGVISCVMSNIWNMHDLNAAFEYTESSNRAICKFLAQLPKALNTKEVKAAIKKHDK